MINPNGPSIEEIDDWNDALRDEEEYFARRKSTRYYDLEHRFRLRDCWAWQLTGTLVWHTEDTRDLAESAIFSDAEKHHAIAAIRQVGPYE